MINSFDQYGSSKHLKKGKKKENGPMFYKRVLYIIELSIK